MIRIVVAEKQQMMLGTIGSLLNLEDDMEVIGLARDGREVLSLVQQLAPDICVLDIDMPDVGGLNIAEELKNNSCRVVILSTFPKQGNHEKALNANVKGYLLKDSPSDILCNSIRMVMAGQQVYMSELIDESKNEDIVSYVEIPSQKKETKTFKTYFSTLVEKVKQPTV